MLPRVKRLTLLGLGALHCHPLCHVHSARIWAARVFFKMWRRAGGNVCLSVLHGTLTVFQIQLVCGLEKVIPGWHTRDFLSPYNKYYYSRLKPNFTNSKGNSESRWQTHVHSLRSLLQSILEHGMRLLTEKWHQEKWLFSYGHKPSVCVRPQCKPPHQAWLDLQMGPPRKWLRLTEMHGAQPDRSVSVRCVCTGPFPDEHMLLLLNF